MSRQTLTKNVAWTDARTPPETTTYQPQLH